MRSLRRTLLFALLAAVASVTGVAAAATYRMARREMDTVLDYQLRQIALSLRDRAARGLASTGDEVTGFDFVIQIWDEDGARIYLSRPGADLPDAAELGFATVHTSTGDWRIFSTALGQQVIQVAQPSSVRERLAFAAATRTLAPLLLLLPLLAFAVWRIVGRGLEPLDRLASAAAARTPAALDPLPEEGVPEEVLPLVRALNRLLVRLGAALSAQRAFVADAAHELRTPLAALKLQVQLAEHAGDEAARAEALSELAASAGRATHLVEQLLTLAREDPEAAGARREDPVPLADLVAQVVADQALLAEAKGIDLGATEVANSVSVRGDASALRTLLANVVDNAVRYTPRGGRVDVSAGVASGRPFLEVRDTGPGIPPADRERVFDRFYRRSGAEPGTGLGLAIVRAIAERHRARVSLGEAPGSGLVVRVDFDGPTPSAPPGAP